MASFRERLNELIELKIAPYRSILGPEVISVSSEIERTGVTRNRRKVRLIGNLNLTAGMLVLAVPIDADNYYAVGKV